MCEWGNTTLVKVRVPADLSAEQMKVWKWKPIDRCIAPVVSALQEAGIDMRGSCCGHRQRSGTILLQGGQELVLEA